MGMTAESKVLNQIVVIPTKRRKTASKNHGQRRANPKKRTVSERGEPKVRARMV